MLESYGELLPQHYTKGGKPGYYPPIKGARPEIVLNLYDPFNFFDRPWAASLAFPRRASRLDSCAHTTHSSSGMTPEAKEAGLIKEINNGRLAMIAVAGFVGQELVSQEGLFGA